jgi:argininosuccinate synthase
MVVQRTISARGRARQATIIEIGFEKGDPVSIDGVTCRPLTLLTEAQRAGRARNGIGRLDLVENRFVGMKSRGVYETPGGTILLQAHRGSSRSRSIAARCISRTS